MFDISWSELLILGVVTLLFVGPKELPRFLGTLGRYAGVVRRQAAEFRRVFDEAMKEAELDELKKSVNEIRDGVTSTLRDVERQADSHTPELAPPAKMEAPEAPPLDPSHSIQPAPTPAPPRVETETVKPETRDILTPDRQGEGH